MEEDRADNFELERISTQFRVPLSADCSKKVTGPSAPQREVISQDNFWMNGKLEQCMS
jgi:hypothetical protein